MHPFLLLLFSLFLLGASAHFLIAQVEKMAKKLRCNLYFLSATLIAASTSLPELATSVVASSSGHYSIALSSIAGSNICNTLVLASALFLLSPISSFILFFEKKESVSSLYRDCLLTIVATTALFILISQDLLNALSGSLVLLLYLLYLYLNLKAQSYPDSEDKRSQLSPEEKKELLQSGLYFLAGSCVLVIAGHYLVQSSVAIAELFSVSERFIGASIVALGTSAPEIATTLSALYSLSGKNRGAEIKEVILGNLLGSNLINFLLILPLSTITYWWAGDQNIPYAREGILTDFFIAAVCLAFLQACFELLKKILPRKNERSLIAQGCIRALGALFFILYALYIAIGSTY